MAIASQVFVLFAVVLAGILSRKLKYFTDETIHGVSELVVNITLPCLTVYNMQRPYSKEVLFNFFLTFFLSLVLISAALFLSYFLFAHSPRERRGILSNLCAMSNCGFMGYPMIMVINPEYMIYAVSFNIAYSVIAWTVGISLVSGETRVHLRQILLNPCLISSLLGLLLFSFNIMLPDTFSDILETIGSLTTPLSMLLVGTRISGLKLSEFTHWEYPVVAVMRLLLFPAASFFLLSLLPVSQDVIRTIFILFAMPCGTLTSIQAELCNRDASFAARNITLTTLLSLATIPLICQLL